MPPEKKGQVEVELRRDLRLFDITMIGIGAMIGAGIFVLSGTAAGIAGPAAILAFALNGLVAALTAFTYAELGSAFPKAGGAYLWVRESIPHPAGFLSGWMSWMAYTVACTLYALGFGSYMAWWLREYNVTLFGLDLMVTAKIFAVAVGLTLLSINYMGTGATGQSENVLTVVKIIILGIFVGLGIFQMLDSPGAFGNFTDEFMPNGMAGILYAMGITFIAFEGYDIIVQCGEEVENPKKNIPKAIFISLIVVVAFYILIMFVAIGATPTEGGQATWEYLGEKEETAMVGAADKFLPYLGLGFIIMMVGGLVSTMSALNATIFSSSRVSFAMGRDGTLPRSFGKIDPVRRTPSTAIWATGAMILIMVVSIPMEDVAASASLLFLGLFVMANISLIILRRKRPDLDRGFMVPLFPWIPLAAIVINTVLIAFLVYNWPLSGWIALAWIEGGLLLYYFTSGEEEITSIDKVEKYIGAKAVPTGKDYHVLVPISNPKSTPLLDLSGVVADRRDGDVVLLNIAKVPNNTPIRDVDPTFMQKHVATAEVVKGYAEKSGVTTRAKVVVSHTIGDTILAEGKTEKANLIILGWMGPKGTRKWLFGYNLDPVIQNAKCDVAVLKSGSFKEVKRIVFAAGFEVNELHSVRAARVAAMLAKRYNIPVEIMMLRRGGVPSDARAKEQLERLKGIFLKRGVGAVGDVVSTSNPVQAVTSKVTKMDLLVMGASDKWKSYRYAFGPMQDAISSRARSGLLYYRAGTLKDVGENGVEKGGGSGGGKSAKHGGRKAPRGGGRKTPRRGAGRSGRDFGGSAQGEDATGFDEGGGGLGGALADIDTTLDVEDPFPRDDSAPARPEDVTDMSAAEPYTPGEGTLLTSHTVDGFSHVSMPCFMSPLTTPVDDDTLAWHCFDSTETGVDGEVKSVRLEPPTLTCSPVPHVEGWRPVENRREDEP